MKLKTLWEQAGQRGELQGLGNPEIRDLVRDSRQITQECLFLCRRGAHFDSHQIVEEVFSSGAAACLLHDPVATSRPCWKIKPEEEGWVAAAFYGHPSQKLRVLAVTGTDGKSTTAWFTTQLLQSAGLRVACLGTLGVWRGQDWEPWSHTTPEAEVLQKTLRQLVDQGFTHVVMEVSSHALSLARVVGVNFDVVGLTNLGRDHLDDYGDLASYHAAKEKLFDLQSDPQFQVRPRQFPGGAYWQTGNNLRVTPYQQGIQIAWQDENWQSLCHLQGAHNYENLQTALGLAGCVADHKKIIEGISSLTLLPGRWQWVEGSEQRVMIDYAHTPGALAELLKNLRPLVKGKLHVLFGCGGNRDAGKRALMGQVASRWADQLWVTDDNPRQEDPAEIRQTIFKGVQRHKTQEIADRRVAIEKAIAHLGEQDVLVIAGKGHESGQIIGDEIFPFNDYEIASNLFEKVVL